MSEPRKQLTPRRCPRPSVHPPHRWWRPSTGQDHRCDGAGRTDREDAEDLAFWPGDPRWRPVRAAGAVVLALLALAMGGPSAAAEDARPVVGVEYGFAGLGGRAEWFAGVASHVKFTDVTWERLEVDPAAGLLCRWFPWLPTCGTAVATWEALDAEVAAWRAAGYGGGLTFVVRSKHPTFARPTVPDVPELGAWQGLGSAPPVDLDRYEAWLRRLVTRYRADVEAWECESELHRLLWRGTAEDYIRLLERFSRVVRELDPSAVVISAGWGVGDLLDDDPDGETIEARLVSIPAPFGALTRESIETTRRQFARADLVDVFELHSLSSPTGIAPALDLARELVELGAPPADAARVRHWVGDTTSAPRLTYRQGFDFLPDLPLPIAAHRMGALSWGPGYPGYAQAREAHLADQVAWFRAKVAAAAAAGADRIYAGTEVDWRVLGSHFLGAVSTFPHQGLADADGRARPVLEWIRRYNAGEAAP